MDHSTQQLIDKFKRNPAIAQSLLQSGDGQRQWFWGYGTDCNGNSWIVENELEQFWTVFKTALYDRIFE